MKSARDKNSLAVTLSEIEAARLVLQKYFPGSPMLFNPWLSEKFGCELYLKLENMLPIGSFKIRGATYRISQLTREERKRGVIAASAGNHAQGVAWGSRALGVDAMIVMPSTAPLMKLQNTRSLGASVVQEGESFDEAYQAAQKIARKTGRVFIPAFSDRHIIAGQGTAGLEIFDELPEVDTVVCSVGGGGLLAGIATALKELRPQVSIVGCQASGSPSMLASIAKGKAVKLDRVETFADGIAIGSANEEVRKILQPRVDRWLKADDEAMAAAILTLMEKAKVVAEAAGALPLAVMEQMCRGPLGKKIKGKKVVLVVTGGNIDVNVLSRVIDRGLIRAGRRVRVNVWISDRTGSLARLTHLIAAEGANVIQAIHDRSEPSTRIDQTEVALTLETRGVEHSQALITALKKHVIRLELVD